jgi:uncharacterized membrane protein YesL
MSSLLLLLIGLILIGVIGAMTAVFLLNRRKRGE